MKEIRVLLLNGSPRANGNTALALREMEKVFAQNGVQTETVLLGNQAIRGCTACGACAKLGRCVFDDVVNELAPKLEAADGLVVASPVYYASANATLIACLDRLFYSTPFDKTMKVGASVVCARRGGCSATFDKLNKYFTATQQYGFVSCFTIHMLGLNMELLGVLFGMMRLNFWTYLSASWLSIAPGMVCLCILGNNLDFKSPVFWAMLALNLVLLLGSLWYTRHKLVQSSSRT